MIRVVYNTDVLYNEFIDLFERFFFLLLFCIVFSGMVRLEKVNI